MAQDLHIDFNLPGLERPASARPKRVAEAVRRELAMLLLRRVQDPRLQHLGISRVEMSSDLRCARIFYALPPEADARAVRRGLERAKGFFRRQVAERLGLRYAPELIFQQDSSLEESARMAQLLSEISEELGRKEQE
ncbi:MAG: ribosome-binding factor A [Desulfobulbaceae bacterium A2]|nr:MAG: ribosome-binding factor A [Desulfobulbaceae bacterium A2]